MIRKSKQKKALLLGAVLSLSCAYAQTAPTTKAPVSSKAHALRHAKTGPVTLLDAFEQALNTNPAILQSIANQQAARQNLSQTRAGYLPTVAASYSVGSSRSSVPDSPYVNAPSEASSITVTQLLFDGGSLGGLVDVAGAQFEESQDLTKSEVNTLAMDTVTAYLSYLQNSRLLTLSKNNLTSHYRTLKGVSKRYHAGAITVSQYELAKSRLAQAQTVLHDNQKALDLTRSQYVRVVGSSPNNLAAPRFDQRALPKSLSQALALADKQNPAILAAEKQLQAAVKSLSQAKSATYSPAVNLELSASRDRNIGGLEGVSVDMEGLVTVSYTLFDGGADLDGIRKAAALKVASEENLADVKRTVANQLRQTWAGMLAAKKNVPAYRKRVASGKKVLESYRKQFKIGKLSLLNVLDVENQLFASETEMLSNQYTLQADYYQILSDIGELPEYFANQRAKHQGHKKKA